MPRVRRKALARHLSLAVEQKHLLWCRKPWLDAANENSLLEAWTAQRDVLLPSWIAAHPGTRPLAWWAFDVQEQRRQEFQIPTTASWLLTNYRRDPKHSESCYEREVDYLQRCGLIVGDELARFERMRIDYEDRQRELQTDEQRQWLAEKRIEHSDSEFGTGWRFTSRTGGLGRRS